MIEIKNLGVAALIFGMGEAAAFVLFYFVRKIFRMDNSDHRVLNITIGILERLVMFAGLNMGISQIVAMFGVFKVAARLKPDDNTTEKKTNEYFLIGNLLSVFLVLIYYWLFSRIYIH